MENIGIVLLQKVIFIAFLSLLGAVFLRVATKWVAETEITFGKAYGTVFIAGFINTTIGIAIGSLIIASGYQDSGGLIVAIVTIFLGFFVLAGTISARSDIVFPKSLFVALVMFLVGAVTVAVGFTVVYLLQ
jgi:hypothetical protein